jgi:aspartyl aminopeptidase
MLKKEKYTWNKYSDEDLKEVFALGSRYKIFLSECKTERECVKSSIQEAERNGYRNLHEIIKNNEKLKPGDKVYANNYNKTLALFIIGTEPFEKGLRILGAHIDAPRLDFKLNPLYEDSGFAMAKTHYYGGVKKYQWVTLPLAIHGLVAKKDGTTVDISISILKLHPLSS